MSNFNVVKFESIRYDKDNLLIIVTRKNNDFYTFRRDLLK